MRAAEVRLALERIAASVDHVARFHDHGGDVLLQEVDENRSLVDVDDHMALAVQSDMVSDMGPEVKPGASAADDIVGAQAGEDAADSLDDASILFDTCLVLVEVKDCNDWQDLTLSRDGQRMAVTRQISQVAFQIDMV